MPQRETRSKRKPRLSMGFRSGARSLSQQHGLTARENDTLLLLAKGRDVPSIAKQLFISENTVRSHSKSIYKKLDIHSKQELLDLLETIELAYENDR